MEDSDICPKCGRGKRIDYQVSNTDKSQRERNFDNYEQDYLNRLENPDSKRKVKPTIKEIITNLTSQDYIVLAAMHYTDLKTMIKINPVELVVSCEKFFDCGLMKKMDGKPPWEIGIKVQNWLNSVEYAQYTKNINKLLSQEDKEKIRRIYVKLELKAHDLSELTEDGIELLEKKKSELNQQWNTLVEYNKSKDVIHLKESMDKFAISIPIMFTMGIANGMLFSAMFSTMGIGMYGYMSENPVVNPIFLDYLTSPDGEPYTDGSGGDFDGGSDGGFETGF